MGMIYRQARMLVDAQRSGVQLRNLLMIGRQVLFLHPSESRALRKVCPGALAQYKWAEYADRFLRDCLGATDVSALDYSDYEGASILHDLSQPISSDLKGQFDAVIEAGTLEHIFNFPTAVANLMQMVRVGGLLSVSTVTNNLCGHGFYQFSPELIFRIFSPDNGFEIGKVLALEARYPDIELAPMSDAYEVLDPASVGQRGGLVSRGPVMLFFEAKKTADLPLFTKSPLQSDYVAEWQSRTKQRVPQWAKELPLYYTFRNWLKGHLRLRQYSFGNQQFYRKVS